MTAWILTPKAAMFKLPGEITALVKGVLTKDLKKKFLPTLTVVLVHFSVEEPLHILKGWPVTMLMKLIKEASNKM